MIPSVWRPRHRADLPIAWIAGGVAGLLVLAFFGWIVVSMYSQPTVQTVTVDVPLAQ